MQVDALLRSGEIVALPDEDGILYAVLVRDVEVRPEMAIMGRNFSDGTPLLVPVSHRHYQKVDPTNRRVKAAIAAQLLTGEAQPWETYTGKWKCDYARRMRKLARQRPKHVE
jgi:hypothetical protein